MEHFAVISGPGSAPVWLHVPEGAPVVLREATESEAASTLPDEHLALLPPPPRELGAGWGQVRLELSCDVGGLTVRVPDGRAASAVEVDHGLPFGAEPRPLPAGRVVRVRHGSPHPYRLLAVAGRAGDARSLLHALVLGARSLEALGDDPLCALLLGALAKEHALAWRSADLMLRERRDFRLPFLGPLGPDALATFEAEWSRSLFRLLARLGFRSPVPIPDRARDWFYVLRPAVERQRAIAPAERDALAVSLARALEALGEADGTPCLFPLERAPRVSRFQLSLSQRGQPEYRLFDVTRDERGEGVVTGRRVKVGAPTQRVLVATCGCGGRLYESDRHCRDCGTHLDELGAVRLHGTFLVGATAEVAALCACGAGVRLDDRYCGGCGVGLT